MSFKRFKIWSVELAIVLVAMVFAWLYFDKPAYSVLFYGNEVSLPGKADWFITGDQLEYVTSSVGAKVIVDDSKKSVIIEPKEAEIEVETSLKPLTKINTVIRERELYGNWVSADLDNVYGYQFQPTDICGPYTVVKIQGKSEDDSGVHDETFIGFYEITDDNRLILYLTGKLNEGNVDKISEKEEWDVSRTGEFIILKNDTQTIQMSKIVAQQ